MKQTMKITLLCTFIVMSLVGVKEAGSGTIDFRELEAEVLKETNLARTAPRLFASHLKEIRKYFHGKELRRPGESPVLTKEGVSALTEAIRFMEKATPVPKLRLSGGMSRGARDHVEVQQTTGSVGHGSAEGNRPYERIGLYGSWEKIVGENIAYGYTHARDAILSFIIDDGVPKRGHRQNILNPNFHVVGVACGPHPVYRTMCVIIFAGGYREKKD
jgi:uncharacterized protein YkwD